MYRCFQLEAGSIRACPYPRTARAEHAFVLRQQTQSIIQKKITKKIIEGDVIDATSLQNDWFPEVEADIFISHSSLDKDKAFIFATWLYRIFGLTAFIDSDVWGHADYLLEQIDDHYCYKKDRNAYDYDLRNFSTSHVHAMLSNALIQMIDKTECLFFLNSPNSIKTENTVGNQTESPWLYLELMATQVVRQRKQDRWQQRKTASVLNQLFPTFQYDVDLSQLPVITRDELEHWQGGYEQVVNTLHPLDVLYYMK